MAQDAHTAAHAGGLLTGTGFDLGPHALRYPVAERTLLRVLADQARQRPDHPWLIFDSTDVLTFADAYDRVLRVAAALRREARAPANVALMLRNQIEFMPAFYGPMAAGGVTVPLNAEARGSLLHASLLAGDADVLIVRTDLLDRLRRFPTSARYARSSPSGRPIPAGFRRRSAASRWSPGRTGCPPRRHRHRAGRALSTPR